jgi:peroxiredoxin
VLVLSALAILVIASLAEYLSLKRMAQAQAEAQGLLATSAVAQTLTNLPLPTMIPTWTDTSTFTALPTVTLTITPTLTPTLKYTLTKTPRPSSLIGPVVGLYAPDFSLTDLVTGERVTLSQFDGQPVLLFFWATWCSMCNNEVDSIETIAQTYKEAGLVVLSINTAEDPTAVSAYQIAHLLAFPVLLDPGSVVQSAYHVNLNAIPIHFFVNSSGRIAFIGKSEMTLNEMKVQVDAIMRRYPTATP